MDFFDEARAEMERARRLWPTNKMQLGALMEEVGELSKSLLEYDGSEASIRQIREEAVQVAAMAGRVALEGDAGSDYRPSASGQDNLCSECGRPAAEQPYCGLLECPGLSDESPN